MNHPVQPGAIILSVSVEELGAIIHRSLNAALDERLPSQPDQPSSSSAVEYLSREETAKLLHVSFETLRKYEKAGTLLPCRLGRRVLYRKEDVDTALQRNNGGGKRP